MKLDIHAIIADPLRLAVFVVLLLVVRGLPALVVYVRVMPVRQRVEMAFITATTMPLLVAIADIGEHDGVMLPANAATLVGAGVVSVLVFPAVATVLSRKDGNHQEDAGAAVPATVPSEGDAPDHSPAGSDEDSDTGLARRSVPHLPHPPAQLFHLPDSSSTTADAVGQRASGQLSGAED